MTFSAEELERFGARDVSGDTKTVANFGMEFVMGRRPQPLEEVSRGRLDRLSDEMASVLPVLGIDVQRLMADVRAGKYSSRKGL